MHVHASELGASPQLRKHLARIEQMVGIESAFDPHLLVEVDLVEHFRHQVALLHPHSVLAGQHAADLDAEPQDVGAETLSLVELAGYVGVVENQRVQVAVAGVKDIGDAEPVFLGEFTRGSSLRGMVPSMQ
jgi:hypothetical protein